MRQQMISRALATAIVMLLSGVAIVARSAGGYDLSLWRVAGGGATSSTGGKYRLAGTIGQPDAGELTGGTLILGGGFWGGGAAVAPKIPGPLFLPLAARPAAVSLCDEYEPNNNRYDDPAPMPSTNVIAAKICSNDVEARYPNRNFEDNYFFDTTTANRIQVTLDLPTSLLSHVSMAIYTARDLESPIPSEGCFKPEIAADPLTTSCSIPQAGRYIVRLYLVDNTVDNVMPYELALSYQ